KMLWKQMYDFSKDCILLVLSNTLYDANEYIRDYNEFLKAVDDT
ncbi:WxcM-like domain-containing protein, partial [Campylobacter coli]|nr:WxcM-like domain-containing protein [Campylobacter coli]